MTAPRERAVAAGPSGSPPFGGPTPVKIARRTAVVPQDRQDEPARSTSEMPAAGAAGSQPHGGPERTHPRRKALVAAHGSREVSARAREARPRGRPGSADPARGAGRPGAGPRRGARRGGCRGWSGCRRAALSPPACRARRYPARRSRTPRSTSSLKTNSRRSKPPTASNAETEAEAAAQQPVHAPWPLVPAAHKLAAPVAPAEEMVQKTTPRRRLSSSRGSRPAVVGCCPRVVDDANGPQRLSPDRPEDERRDHEPLQPSAERRGSG